MNILEKMQPYHAQGCFNEEQLYEIRKGLEAGYDVSTYADPNLSASEMNKIRTNITKKTNPTFIQRPIGKIVIAVMVALLILEVAYIALRPSDDDKNSTPEQTQSSYYEENASVSE